MSDKLGGLKGFMRTSPGPSFTKGRGNRYFVGEREASDTDEEGEGRRKPQKPTAAAVEEPVRDDGWGNARERRREAIPQVDGESFHENSRQPPGGAGRDLGHESDGDDEARESEGSAIRDAGERASGKTSNTLVSEGHSTPQDAEGSSRTPVQAEGPERREGREGPHPAADLGGFPISALQERGSEGGGDDQFPGTGASGAEGSGHGPRYQPTAESTSAHLPSSPFTGLLGLGPRNQTDARRGQSAGQGMAPLPLPLSKRAAPKRIAGKRRPKTVFAEQYGDGAARWGRQSGKVRRRPRPVIPSPKLGLPKMQKTGTARKRRDTPSWANRAPKLPGGRGPRVKFSHRR